MHIFIVVAIMFFSQSTQALVPITPEDVFSAEELRTIIEEKNFFLFNDMDLESPIWKGKNRKYSKHFLGERDYFLDMDQVIHRVLSDAFPLQYRIDELFRAKMRVHAQIGQVIPKINISFGQGITGIDVSKIFSGLFGFLLPANWMKLVNQRRVLKTVRYITSLTLLDEILKAKIAYIDQHQRIQDLEIRNYYFIHLQIMMRIYGYDNRVIKTLIGRYSFEGTEMANQRGRTKLGFDQLAHLMAMEHANHDRTVSKLNIKDIEDFPTRVPDVYEFSNYVVNKKSFLNEVVKKSIGLKLAKEYLKISKLNVGIVAFGSMFSAVENSNHDAQFAFNFGYDMLPHILIAKSLLKTTKIDLRKGYLRMLNEARKSYDIYTNSLGAYTESRRSIKYNRQAFIQNLQYIVSRRESPDAIFIISLNQLIQTELKLNNAFHTYLRAKALMERYLLHDKDNFIKHLPKKSKVIKALRKVKISFKRENDKKNSLDMYLQIVNKSSELDQFLKGSPSQIKGKVYSEGEIEEGVKRNIADLLSAKHRFHKSKKFYLALRTYIERRQIILSSKEQYILDKKLGTLNKKDPYLYFAN